MAPPRSAPVKGDNINSGSWDDVPEQFGSRREIFQPGPYRWQLPPLAVLGKAIETLKDVTINGKEGTFERIVAVLKDGAELKCVQSPHGKRNGDALPIRISNVERNRARKGEDPRWASDMDYLLKETGVPSRPRNNAEYRDGLLTLADKEFGADIELNCFCNAKKPIRVKYEGDQQTTLLDGEEGREKQLGCGKRYYGADLPKTETGETERSMECDCGAILYANENLVNFRK